MPDVPMHLYESTSHHRSPPAIATRTFADARRAAEAADPIFALWRATIDARRRFCQAQAAEMEAVERAYSRFPARPAHLFAVREMLDGEHRPMPFDRLEIEQWIAGARKSGANGGAEAIETYKSLLRDLDAHEAERAKVARKLGLPALRKAVEEAEDALDIAEERLGTACSMTLRGAIVKLRFGLRRYYYSPAELQEPAPQTVQSTIRDLVRLRRSTREQSHA